MLTTALQEYFYPIDNPKVVFDDQGLIVVAKPAGMHCSPASRQGTLCHWLYSQDPEPALVQGHSKDEGGLLHRLDAATSGLVAFARNDSSFAFMKAAQANGLFSKHYYAMAKPENYGLTGSVPVLAIPLNSSGSEWARILRNCDMEKMARLLNGAKITSCFRPFGPGAKRVACAQAGIKLPGGKAWGKTVYESRILNTVVYDKYMFLELSLEKGYRHQLRAHMAWLGLPLLGDSLYGEGFQSEKEQLFSASLYLRACKLVFPSPVDGKKISIEI